MSGIEFFPSTGEIITQHARADFLFLSLAAMGSTTARARSGVAPVRRGPVLGAAFFLLFQDWISDLTIYWWLFMGIFFIVVVLYLEGGLISLFNLDRIWLWVNRQEK